jgi:hypothetical protein
LAFRNAFLIHWSRNSTRDLIWSIAKILDFISTRNCKKSSGKFRIFHNDLEYLLDIWIFSGNKADLPTSVAYDKFWLIFIKKLCVSSK